MADINFLIGADPEVFVRDPNGNLVSGYGMIPGTKDSPFKVEHGAVQVDGMALEFNIDPASTFKEFNRNINAVVKQLTEMLPPGHTLDFIPVADFGQEYIDAQPEEARLLGCNPDFNAYTHEPNPMPSGDYGFRTASGHIHIGWTNDQDIEVPEHLEACRMAVKQLDVTIGSAQRIWDHDVRRSRMYGKMGAHRPKPYGVEYRTLSNTWVNDEDRRRLVFDMAMASMERLMEGQRIYEDWFMGDMDYDINRGYWPNVYYVSDRVARRIGGDIHTNYQALKRLGPVVESSAEHMAECKDRLNLIPALVVNDFEDFDDDAFFDDVDNEDEAVGF